MKIRFRRTLRRGCGLVEFRGEGLGVVLKCQNALVGISLASGWWHLSGRTARVWLDKIRRSGWGAPVRADAARLPSGTRFAEERLADAPPAPLLKQAAQKSVIRVRFAPPANLRSSAPKSPRPSQPGRAAGVMLSVCIERGQRRIGQEIKESWRFAFVWAWHYSSAAVLSRQAMLCIHSSFHIRSIFAAGLYYSCC